MSWGITLPREAEIAENQPVDEIDAPSIDLAQANVMKAGLANRITMAGGGQRKTFSFRPETQNTT